MKKLIATVGAFLVLVSASLAVNWDVVSVSIVVRASNPATGGIQTTILNNRKYLDATATRFGVPRSDLFIGLREDTGQVSIVQRSTETVLYNIVSGLGGGGVAQNAAGTLSYIAVSATVSSLNTDFTGFISEVNRRFTSGKVKSISRSVVGGSPGQTIKGLIRTTGRVIVL